LLVLFYYYLFLFSETSSLETVEHDRVGVANFLIDEKGLDVGPLVARQLDDLAHVFVFLHRPVAGKILFKSLADAFHVQVFGQAGHRRDTFAPIALLDPHVDLVARVARGRTRVFKGVCVYVFDKVRRQASQVRPYTWSNLPNALKLFMRLMTVQLLWFVLWL
jgi:hypothetical protein